MKRNGWKLHRAQILCLSVLLLAGVGIVANTTDSFAQWTPAEMLLHYLLGYHSVQIESGPTFEVETTESISAEGDATKRFTDRNGLSTLPVRIHGMAGRGYAEGVGETMYWLDKSRPVEGSMVRGKARGVDFPAVHEMRFHLLLTTEILPGRTFRSINPAVMVNNNSMSFPPQIGSRYALKNVIEFEDVEEPGVVVLRILSNRNQIIGDGRSGPGLGRRPHEG